MRAALLSLVVLSSALSCSRAAVSCRTVADCDKLDGQRVQIVGIYRALPHPKGAVRGENEPIIARVDLEGVEGPYLEPFWSKDARRSDEELRRLDGQRVRVTGIYHRVQPHNPDDPPYAEAMGGACVSDVDIALVPRAP